MVKENNLEDTRRVPQTKVDISWRRQQYNCLYKMFSLGLISLVLYVICEWLRLGCLFCLEDKLPPLCEPPTPNFDYQKQRESARIVLKDLGMVEHHIQMMEKTGEPCTDWAEWLRCNCANVIERIDAHDSRLSGTLSTHLGDLEHVQRIDLSNNYLRGSIPSEIGRLRDLREFYVNSNSLEGTVPPVLFFGGDSSNWGGKGNSVVKLDLGSNYLSGSLPSIVYYDDDDHRVSLMTRLEELDLSRNMFTGDITGFAELLKESSNNLEILVLNDNYFDGLMPKSFPLSLEYLNVRGNTELAGTFPVELVDCKELRYLDVSRTNITGNMSFLCDEISGIHMRCEDTEILDCTCTSEVALKATNFSLLKSLNKRLEMAI